MDAHLRSYRPMAGPSSSSTKQSARRLLPIWTTPSTNGSISTDRDLNLLSPPITPVKRPAIDIPPSTMEFPPTPRASLDERPDQLPGITMIKTRQFKGNYKINRKVGSGSWAHVYLAEESRPLASPRSPAESGLTPPPSPAMLPTKSLAIKQCYRKDGMRSLSHEARVLTYLASDPATAPHVVPFHGVDDETNSLILDFAPLTLERYSKHALARAKQELSTKNMYDPVVGEAEFRRHARAMIKGLAEMHAKGVVHGDIKAENILMRRRDDSDSYEPVFCDFSTAILVRDEDVNAGANADATDAQTQRYMSPELLASMSRSYRGGPVDRRKADVWALAMCIIMLATGHEVYSELAAKPSYMSIPWIQRGDILGSTRENSGQATRIMKRSRIAKSVVPALAHEPEERATAQAWLEEFDQLWEN